MPTRATRIPRSACRKQGTRLLGVLVHRGDQILDRSELLLPADACDEVQGHVPGDDWWTPLPALAKIDPEAVARCVRIVEEELGG